MSFSLLAKAQFLLEKLRRLFFKRPFWCFTVSFYYCVKKAIDLPQIFFNGFSSCVTVLALLPNYLMNLQWI